MMIGEPDGPYDVKIQQVVGNNICKERGKRENAILFFMILYYCFIILKPVVLLS